MPEIEYDNQLAAPGRRRRLVRFALVAAALALVSLVVLMSKGPDPEALARKIIDSAFAQLPDTAISIDQIRTVSAELIRAAETAPDASFVKDETRSFLGRVEMQLTELIEDGALETAGDHLQQLHRLWPETSRFGESAPLTAMLTEARFYERVTQSLQETTALVQGGDVSAGVSQSLVARLDAQFAALIESKDLLQGQAGIPSEVQQLLTAITDTAEQHLSQGHLRGGKALLDSALTALDELGDIAPEASPLREAINDLLNSAEAEKMNQLASERLQADRLANPPNDSALFYFGEALRYDPENARAREGIAGVENRYQTLVEQALGAKDLGRSRRLLSRFRTFAPDHRSIGKLQRSLDQAVATAAAGAAAARAEAEAAAASVPTAPGNDDGVVETDAEGRLWAEVKDNCQDGQLQRYIDRYPSGRHVEDAWRQRSLCLRRGR